MQNMQARNKTRNKFQSMPKTVGHFMYTGFRNCIQCLDETLCLQPLVCACSMHTFVHDNMRLSWVRNIETRDGINLEVVLVEITQLLKGTVASTEGILSRVCMSGACLWC
jgi:hypothetical protein